MSIRWTNAVASIFVGLLVALPAYAQTSALLEPAPGMPYPQLRTWHEQSLAFLPTREERLENLRKLVRSGSLGQRGLDRMFKDFEGMGEFDPRIPGIEKNVRLTASKNPSVAKGAARNHVYAVRVAHHPEFRLLAVDEPVIGPNGRMITDKDIRFEHIRTGIYCRIESKDVSIESQRGNPRHYQEQIDKMAAEYRATGELQAFVNRRDVIPALKEYASEQGIPVYENVVTSERGLGPRQTHFDAVLQDLNRQANLIADLRLLGGGMEVGLGMLIVVQNAPAVCQDIRELLDPAARTKAVWLRLGEHGTAASGGTLLASAGAIKLAARFSETVAASTRLMALSKWAGRAGIVVVILADTFVVWQYHSGALGERQFWTIQYGLAGGLTGGVVGAWAGVKVGAATGAAIGAFFGPEGPVVGAAIGGVVGGVAGGFGGGYVGSSLAVHSVNRYYEFGDQQQERRYIRFVAEHYGARL